MVCAFAGYVAWNIHWLASARIPPSILTELTGIPCPTTGGTRSLLALLEGDWSSSLSYNAMTVPLILLLGMTMIQVSRRRVVDPWLGKAWLGVLGLAWVLKLLVPESV